MPRRRMKHASYLIVAGGLLVSTVANADIIACSFTEPFIRTSYDTSSKRMTVTYDVEKRRRVFDRVSMHETAPKAFEFRNANGQVLQRAKRSCRGSDGMSDRVYPYEAEWVSQKLYGGCTSTGMTRC